MTAVRNIDYWGIVTRSAQIAWGHKFLWFFGFFAASGGGGGGSNWNVGDRGVNEIRDFFTAHVEVLVAIVMGVVILWLVLLVMNIISKGALLSCIARADRGESIYFEEGWRAGLKSFWGLLGISLLGLLAFLVVSGLCVLAVVLPLVGGAPGIAIAIVIGAVLFIPYLAFLFLLAFTVIYAEREYVLAGGGVMDAIGRGWELTKSYFWQSMLMWLVAFASALVFFMCLVIALLVMALPFILIGVASPIVGLVLGIPVGIVAMILAVSAYSTYDHGLWTLMYCELTGTASGQGVSGAPIDPEARATPAIPEHLPGHGPDPLGRGTDTGDEAPPESPGEPEATRGDEP
jgi:hypothetical protein